MPFGHYLSYLKKFDWLLLIPALLLIFFGLATLYSSTLNVDNPDWTLFNKQLMFFGIGLILLIIASLIDYRAWQRYSLVLYIVSLALMVAVLFWGTEIRGTTGWFYILGFGLQPVELMKFALVLVLAYIYAKRKSKKNDRTTLVFAGLLTLLPIIFAMMQPDFGSAVVLMGIGLGFYAITNMKPKHLLFIIITVILLSILMWNFVLLDYQKDRIMTFVNPMHDPLGKGYNVRQSIIAVGSGELTGRGLGLGTQSQLRFLPETATDFVFAVIAESLGFLGVLLILIFFVIFFIKILSIMRESRDDFSMYLVYGLGLIFFIQTIINIGMNIGLLPVVGLSLPFVSYGGSFLIISMFSVGIIESVRLRQKII